MHSTWRPAASSRSFSPTVRAVAPPTPASTSSNTTVGGAVRGGGDAHQREHHARQLAAGSDLAQRPGRHTHVGSDRRTRSNRPRGGRSGPAGPRPTPGAPLGTRSNVGSLHGQLCELSQYRLLQAARAVLARGGELTAPAATAGPPRGPAPARSPAASRSAFASRSRSARQRSACSSTAAIVPPCLRFRRASRSSRSSTSSSRPGLRLQALLVGAQLAAQLLRLVHQRSAALGQRVERPVVAGGPAKLGLRRREAAERPPAGSSPAAGSSAADAAAAA